MIWILLFMLIFVIHQVEAQGRPEIDEGARCTHEGRKMRESSFSERNPKLHVIINTAKTESENTALERAFEIGSVQDFLVMTSLLKLTPKCPHVLSLFDIENCWLEDLNGSQFPVRMLLQCENCLNCYQGQCLACKENYKSIENRCFRECPEFDQVGNCLSCDDCSSVPWCIVGSVEECIECTHGFFLDECKECIPCSETISNCKTCSNDGRSCQACHSAYYLQNNECVFGHSIPDCKDYNHGNCESCITGYYLENNQCTRCPKNCLECTVDGCSLCVESFHLLNGKCLSCSPPEHCLEASETCECQRCEPSYFLVFGECSFTCPKYFQPGEVEANFSMDYTKIMVFFRNPVLKPKHLCSELIWDLSLMGENPVCMWANQQTLEIFLGKDNSMDIPKIDLKAIQKSQGECSDPVEHLSVDCKSLYPFPKPEFYIEGDSSYSLACAGQDLTLFVQILSGIGNHSPIYKWSVSGFALTNGFQTNLSYLKVPKNDLKPGKYKFSVLVINIFGQSTEKSKTVTVIKDRFISVSIDADENTYMLSSESRTFTATVDNYCGEEASISWEYIGVLEGVVHSSPKSVLNNSKHLHKLTVNPGDLPQGYIFVFRASANNGANSGEAFINIHIEETALVANIDYTDGTYSNEADLFLSGEKSYDPSGESGKLLYSWYCLDQNNDCVDDKGILVINEEYGKNLLVPKERLQTGTTYKFILEVAKDSRRSMDVVHLTLVPGAGIRLKGTRERSVVNFQSDYILHAGISTTKDVAIKWTQTLGPKTDFSSSGDFPYLRFAPNALMPGQKYRFEVKVTSEDSFQVAEFGFLTSMPPICLGGLQVITNVEHVTLLLSECLDADLEYPLKFSFGVTRENKHVPLMCSHHSNLVTIRQLPKGNFSGVVCDKVGTCSTYSVYFEGSERRELNFMNLTESFHKDTQNPDLIPLTVFSYSATYSLTLADWEMLFNALDEYLDSFTEIEPVLLSTTVMCFDELLDHWEILDAVHISYTINMAEKAISKSSSKLTAVDIEILLNSVSEINENSVDNDHILSRTQELVDLVLNNSVKNFPPNDMPQIFEGQRVSTFKQRSLAHSFHDKVISVSQTVVKMPSVLPFSASDVVSVEICEYKKHGNFSDSVEISFSSAGVYQDYALELTDELKLLLHNLPEAIRISFRCKIKRTEGFACAHYDPTADRWKPECTLLAVNNSICTIETVHTSMFSIVADQFLMDTCHMSLLPVYLTLTVVAVCSLLALNSCRSPEMLEEESDGIKVYALDTNRVQEKSTEPREIVVVDTPSYIANEYEDIITPEFRNQEGIPQDTDEEVFEIANNWTLFAAHHIVFGQLQEYYYPKYKRAFLLLMNIALTTTFVGLLLGMDYYYTFEDCVYIALASVVGSLVITSGVELLLATGTSWGDIISLILLVTLTKLSMLYIVYASAVYCSDATELWGKVSIFAVFCDLFMLQNLIAGAKLFAFKNN